ncbi:oxidoreductase [Aliikangiella sp. IMCC44653]
MSNDNELFKNLKALEDASFPKACHKCGNRFENEAEYIAKTIPYTKSPSIAESQDNAGQSFVKVIRQCNCGMPIVDHFGDRRDMSQRGEIRRQAFEKVIVSLIEKGVSREIARQEMMKYMRGNKSLLLEKLGIFKS